MQMEDQISSDQDETTTTTERPAMGTKTLEILEEIKEEYRGRGVNKSNRSGGCQICHKTNHTIANCCHRMYPYFQPQQH